MTTGGLDERALRRLLEVGQDLVAELDLPAVLDRVLKVARSTPPPTPAEHQGAAAKPT
jgi:ABC-type phosphonate transport system ATPase subunit